MRTLTHYWTVTKDGECITHDRPPKRDHVVETVVVLDEFQKTEHTLEFDGQTVTFLAACGYDRGPKRFAYIRRLLGRQQ